MSLLRQLGYPDRALIMKNQVIIYWSDDDEAFIAEVPDLPGCMADGATQEEALMAVRRIADEWCETARALGRPIPEPRRRLRTA